MGGVAKKCKYYRVTGVPLDNSKLLRIAMETWGFCVIIQDIMLYLVDFRGCLVNWLHDLLVTCLSFKPITWPVSNTDIIK